MRAERLRLWRLEGNGIEAIYLPSWLRYPRALSWRSGDRKILPCELWRVDVAHIFGLYDFLGPRQRQPAGAAECPA